MNTGHDGSMTTVHSNGTRDTVRRVESMVSMAGLNYPINVIRQQVASAVNLLVHADRLTGGRRKIMAISEITGMEAEVVLLQDIFKFIQTGIDKEGNATGHHESCGVRPKILERIRAEGHDLSDDLFFQGRLNQDKDKDKDQAKPEPEAPKPTGTAQIRMGARRKSA
jgi:pilus assembly protein CpaF